MLQVGCVCGGGVQCSVGGGSGPVGCACVPFCQDVHSLTGVEAPAVLSLFYEGSACAERGHGRWEGWAGVRRLAGDSKVAVSFVVLSRLASDPRQRRALPYGWCAREC